MNSSNSKQHQEAFNPNNVHLENPLSSTGTLSSMKNLEDNFTFGDQFINDKPTKEDLRKSNVESEVESMVTVPIHQASSLVPPISTLVINLTPTKPISSTIQEPIFTATTETTTTPSTSTTSITTKHNRSCDKTVQGLSSRVFTLELRDLPYKIDQTINEVVKEAVQTALEAPLYECFRDLSEADMKEIIHQRMFESGSYKSHPDHKALYEALEVSMDRDNQEALHETLTTSCKRHRDKQDPPPPPLKQGMISMLLQKLDSQSEQPSDDIPIPDDMHLSYSEDTGADHLPKIKTKPDWLKPIPEEETSETPEPDWVIPLNDLPKLENNWADAIAKSYKDPEENKLLRKTGDIGPFIKWYCKQIRKSKLSKADLEGPAFKIDLTNPEGNRVVPNVSKPLPLGGPPDFGLEELVPLLWIESERDYDISAAYDISHWCFKCKEFYITRHSAPSDRRAVRSQMKILSVVSLKTFSRYSYTYLKEIILRMDDYQDYKISEANFKNLYPNDFEDLYLLHLQGKLNHLSGSDKVALFNDVNLWIMNIVIRHRVEDLQLDVKSYQTKLNLTQPKLNRTGKHLILSIFKEDYTNCSKPSGQ
ncbi:hypothetical protein Tco_1038715 [Tanacetum coccineum]